MLETIFLTPLIIVVVGALIHRYKIRRKPYSVSDFACIGCFCMAAIALPLSMGVWIPDFLGFRSTIGKATTSSGHELRVEQSWNYMDFYTTTVFVKSPDGTEHGTTVDGDDSKSWRVPVALDEATRTATITLSGDRTTEIKW